MTSRAHRPARFRLKLLAAALLALPAGAACGFDPAAPGPDEPPAGASLFEQAFAGASGLELPFPFRQLLARLEARVAPNPAGGAHLPAVLIPYGRSLQRHLGSLASPRIVVGVDRGTAPGDPAPLWLKDRLYLGYQPRAHAIEVISYNPAAARFEFQVIEDYRRGARPRLRNASRAMCTACHQNGGPIFAEEGWEESNASPRVEAALARRAAVFHGVPVAGGHRAAAAIDNATDRANLLAAQQSAWRLGCQPAGGTQTTAAGCRAGLLLAMLQSRMGPFAYFSTTSEPYRRHYLPVASRAWAEHWPGGMPIPSPDLANRRPLESPDPAHVTPSLSALAPRPGATVWPRAQGINRMVVAMSESLPERDLRRIDRELIARARRDPPPQTRYRGSCLAPAEETGRGGLTCRLGEGRVVVDLRRGYPAPEVTRIEGPDGTIFYAVSAEPAAHGLTLRQRPRGLSLRLSDGSRLDRLVLEPDGSDASLTRFQDFGPVEAAARRLAGPQDPPSSALRRETFDGPRLTSALLAALGARPTAWCCAAPPTQRTPAQAKETSAGAALEPAAENRVNRATAASPQAGFALLAEHCGKCHGGPGPQPPAFLAGPAPAPGLNRLAPCLMARLGQWELAPGRRSLSPMPPWTALRARGIEPQAWPSHPDYRRLLRVAEALLEPYALARRDADHAALSSRGSAAAPSPPPRCAP